MNHYPRHLGDYLKATLSLTMQEDGAYTRLTDVYYDTEKPLPLDHRELHRLTRCSSVSDRKAVDKVIARYFEKREDGYHQKRCDLEIAGYRERSASAARSAIARWNKEHANRNANASTNAMRTHTSAHSVGNASHKPLIQPHVEETPTVPSAAPPKTEHRGANSPSNGKSAQWWKSSQGIEQKAKELHLSPLRGETHEQLKERCFEAQKR